MGEGGLGEEAWEREERGWERGYLEKRVMDGERKILETKERERETEGEIDERFVCASPGLLESLRSKCHNEAPLPHKLPKLNCSVFSTIARQNPSQRGVDSRSSPNYLKLCVNFCSDFCSACFSKDTAPKTPAKKSASKSAGKITELIPPQWIAGKVPLILLIAERDRGVSKRTERQRGGTCPESCPWKPRTLTPKLRIFLECLRKGTPDNLKF